MIFDHLKKNPVVLEALDFIVIGFSFFVASSMLPPASTSEILPQALVYSVVILLSIRLGRQLMPDTLTSRNIIIKMIVNNAAGLFFGAGFLVILGNLFSWSSAITIIVASIIAFFMLGTLSPLLKPRNQLSC